MRVAVAACGATWEAAVLAEIERTASLQLVRRCVDVADLLATVATHRLDGALVDVAAPGLDLTVVERLAAAGTQVASVELDGSHLGIGRTLRAGELAGWIRERTPVAAPPDRRGRVVAVWGPSGAPGRSSLAVSIAASAVAAGRRTVLVDADVHGGSIGQWLGIVDEVSGVMAACRDAQRGAVATLDEHLLALDERLNVLTGVPRADMWRHVRPAAIEAVVQRLAADHDLVVVDCGFAIEADNDTSPDRIGRRVLDLADEVVAVGRVDPIGLSRLVRAVADMGPWACTPCLVLNAFRPTLGWSEREVATIVRDLTGVSPWGFLPYDRSGHDAAIMAGRPMREVAPGSGYVSRVDRLTAKILSA